MFSIVMTIGSVENANFDNVRDYLSTDMVASSLMAFSTPPWGYLKTVLAGVISASLVESNGLISK